MARTGIIEGKDIMVFIDPAGGTAYKRTAAATSHKISHKAETKSNKRVTKDSEASKWTHKQVVGFSTTISVNALRSATVEGGTGYAEMLQAYKTGNPVKLKYGFASEEAGDTYEEGLFIIASMDEDTPAEGDATWQASFESSGEVKTVASAGKGAAASGSNHEQPSESVSPGGSGGNTPDPDEAGGGGL